MESIQFNSANKDYLKLLNLNSSSPTAVQPMKPNLLIIQIFNQSLNLFFKQLHSINSTNYPFVLHQSITLIHPRFYSNPNFNLGKNT